MTASTSAPTFTAALARQLRDAGSRPLVTWYDDRSGERVELSVVTYANWVAKTANLLQDDVGLERGDTVAVLLPTHWLTPVWLGAVWSLGAAVTDRPEGCDVVVCGPDGLSRHAGGVVPVVALSLLPMGARFTQPLPPGVVDFGAVVWGQPDAFTAYDPAEGTDVAWRSATEVTQQQLLQRAAASEYAAPGTRLLTDLDPCSAEGLDCLLGPLIAGGGTVWVAHPEDDAWARHAESERVTLQLRR